MIKESNTEFWESWNEKGGPNYPHEKLIQFIFKNYKGEINKINVLDLGCGGGVHTDFLLKLGFKVSGIDISANGIEKTKARLISSGLQAVDLRVGSIHEIDYPIESFELIICVGVIDSAGFQISQSAIQKAFSLLKSGGRFFALFAHNDDYRKDLLADIGFKTYSKDEVELLFNQNWTQLNIDFYTTTYENQKYMQKDFLITAIK